MSSRRRRISTRVNWAPELELLAELPGGVGVLALQMRNLGPPSLFSRR